MALELRKECRPGRIHIRGRKALHRVVAHVRDMLEGARGGPGDHGLVDLAALERFLLVGGLWFLCGNISVQGGGNTTASGRTSSHLRGGDFLVERLRLALFSKYNANHAFL